MAPWDRHVSIPSQSGSLLSELTSVDEDGCGSRLNTLTVGQPLVGRLAVTLPSSPVSIPSQSGSLLSGDRTAESDWAAMVSIPSQSGSLLSGATSPAGSSRPTVSIPSQSGSLLSVALEPRRDNPIYQSQYPHSRAASCRVFFEWGGVAYTSLNTLTVGQPLVGDCTPSMPAKDCVSIPSQSGSLLSAGVGQRLPRRGNGLNTLTVGQPLVGSRPSAATLTPAPSQYPHSRAASCRVATPISSLPWSSLNTLTVGQPLVGIYCV